MSTVSNDRKNSSDDTNCKEDRKKIGGKAMDLRLNGNRLEFGREIKCENDEIVRKLRTAGILHSANRFKLLTMDIPKGKSNGYADIRIGARKEYNLDDLYDDNEVNGSER
ncbi:hypothetical protein C1646_750317 [Rhizophagus diaphanus]|nr:hypothetical protein C1646_750317 [Rhizophagus diaphanus] [Rhizophagus sp. MUCL 43196]